MRTDRAERRPSERAVEPEAVPAPRRREGFLFVAVATWLELDPETKLWNETSARAESRSREGLPNCEAELRTKYDGHRDFRIVLHVEDLATGRTREIREAPAVSRERGRQLAAELRAAFHDRGVEPADEPAGDLELDYDDGEPF